jgi:hypothetical protein
MSLQRTDAEAAPEALSAAGALARSDVMRRARRAQAHRAHRARESEPVGRLMSVAWPVRFGCSSAAEPPVAQRWRRRRRPARGSDQGHSRGPHRAQQLCVGRIKRWRAPAPMGSGGAGVDKFAHPDPGVSTGGTRPGARESSTFVGLGHEKATNLQMGALTLRSARSTVSERSPFAAFSRMARPGLEPGTPRFSGTGAGRTKGARLQAPRSGWVRAGYLSFPAVRAGLGHERSPRGLNGRG